MKEFYNRSVREVLQELGASESGLTKEQVQKATEKYGSNTLAEGKKKGIVAVFLEQFKDLLIVILIAAAIISMVSGHAESSIVIFVVILLNAVLGTVQYFKAEKSLASLKALSSPNAKVLRDNVKVEIPSGEIVPGDIILLEAGDLVCADGRICENYSIVVNESSLTGESDGVEKHSAVIEHENVPLGDRKNMVYSGSLVTYGRATVVATGTGMNTELGKIASLMNATKQRKTPLQESLDKFSRKLALVILAICVVVFALSIYREMPILDSLMFAVALAVAAIPEALSSIVTIVLALGTQKMAKQNAIIKELKAVESLGSVSVICCDKTGTLTQNKMTTQQLYVDEKIIDSDGLDMNNKAHDMLINVMVLASDAIEENGVSIGDPTEVALVVTTDKYGVDEIKYRDKYRRYSELAFDSDRKLMSTLHMLDGVPTMLTKGALDVIIARSETVMLGDGIKPLTEDQREKILAINEEMSAQGLRVLAFAMKRTESVCELSLEDENNFTFVGLVSMIDPPRTESIQAVKDARQGGIKTIMITGDHKVTATAIAKQIGIFTEGDLTVEGVELAAMSDEELDEKLPRISVYARVSPEHKIRIVDAWQRRGNIVSMTGDGVNDAPALKKADIGVAMGITGTEVSKDAASMILTDDNFATIVKAVVNGRNVYENIKHAIQFLLSGNTAGIFCVLYTSILGLPVPFAPVHLLFINLLTDSLPAIAIGMEESRGDLLNRKPRDPKKGILDKSLMGLIGWQGALIAIATMVAFYLGLNHGNAVLASTMAFGTLTFARLWHGFNCRSESSIFKIGLFSNLASVGAFAIGTVLLALVLTVPFLMRLFMVEPLSGMQLLQIALLAVAPTVIIQITKVMRELFKKRNR